MRGSTTSNEGVRQQRQEDPRVQMEKGDADGEID